MTPSCSEQQGSLASFPGEREEKKHTKEVEEEKANFVIWTLQAVFAFSRHENGASQLELGSAVVADNALMKNFIIFT